jgi:hypothetical protein
MFMSKISGCIHRVGRKGKHLCQPKHQQRAILVRPSLFTKFADKAELRRHKKVAEFFAPTAIMGLRQK